MKLNGSLSVFRSRKSPVLRFVIWSQVFIFSAQTLFAAIPGDQSLPLPTTGAPIDSSSTSSDVGLPEFIRNTPSAEQSAAESAAQSFGGLSPRQVEFIDIVAKSNWSKKAPAIIDNFLLKDQYRRKFKIFTNAQGMSVDVPDGGDISLHQINSSLEPIVINNFKNEVRLRYDSATRELLFERFYFNKDLKRDVVTEAHVFKNLDITTTSGAPFILDNNVALFSTNEGIRCIFRPFINQFLFNANIPAGLIQPSVAMFWPGAHVEKISFLTPEVEPQSLFNTAGVLQTFDHEQNVVLQVNIGSGEKVAVRLDYGTEVVQPLSVQLLHLFQQLTLVTQDSKTLDIAPEILRGNAADLMKVELARASIVETPAGNGSDLQLHVLGNLARQIDLPTLATLLKKDASGKNAFQTLTGENRNLLSTTPHGIWTEDFETILQARQKELAKSEPSRPWRDVILDKMKTPDKNVKDALEVGDASQKQLTQSYTRRILGTVGKVLSNPVVKIGLISLGSAVAGDMIDNANNHRAISWILSWMSRGLNACTAVPVIGSISGELATALPTFAERWALTKVMFATLAILAFNPISYVVAKGLATVSGQSWDKVQAFFNLGARLYGKGNYPVQKLIWERVFRQKNLYKARQYKIPMLERRGLLPRLTEAWNSPLARNSTIQSNSEKIDRRLNTEAIQNTRAKIIAALILSEKSALEGEPIDAPNLLMGLQAAEEGKLSEYVTNLINDPERATHWSKSSMFAYRLVAELPDGGIKPIDLEDAEQIQHYSELFGKVRDEFYKNEKATKSRPTLLSRTGRYLAERWGYYKRLTSQNIIPFFLFSDRGYQEFRRFANVEIPARDADTGRVFFDTDYSASTIGYGVLDPRNFKGIADGVIPSMAEVGANQVSQVFFYGIIGGVESLVTNQGGFNLANPAPPFYRDERDLRNMASTNKGIGIEQSFGEATKAIATELVNPDAKRSLIENQLQRMDATGSGYQVRFIFDVIFRALAMGVTVWAAGEGAGQIAHAFAAAFPASANFLLSKVSFQFDQLGHFAMGYAVFWSFMFFGVNTIKDRAEENLKKVGDADYYLDAGIRTDNPAFYQLGADLMQKEYAAGGLTSLPPDLQIEPTAFSKPLATRLVAFSKQNPPLPTVANSNMKTAINMGGSLFSTIVFTAVSHVLYNRNFDAAPQLIRAVEWFGGSYIILTEINRGPLKPTLRLGHAIAEPFVNAAKPVVSPVVERVLKPLAKSAFTPLAAIGKPIAMVKRAIGERLAALREPAISGVEKVAEPTLRVVAGAARACRAIIQRMNPKKQPVADEASKNPPR